MMTWRTPVTVATKVQHMVVTWEASKLNLDTDERILLVGYTEHFGELGLTLKASKLNPDTAYSLIGVYTC